MSTDTTARTAPQRTATIPAVPIRPPDVDGGGLTASVRPDAGRVRLEAAGYAATFFRDVVRLDAALMAHIVARAAGPGPILVAGREVTIAGPVSLHGRDLVLLADTLDGSQGAVQVQGVTERPAITVACRFLKGLTAAAVGAPGAAGSPGRAGRAGRPGRDASLPFKPGGPGGAGGDGGTGLPGGVGGQGGVIALSYVVDAVPGTFDLDTLSAPGGQGGPGGEGGPGGQGGQGGEGEPPGRDGPDGDTGAAGPAGPPGPLGSISAAQVDDDGLLTAMVGLADEWPAYRTKVGEFYFRGANPTGPPRDAFLQLALDELSAAAALAPADPRPAELRDRILLGHTVLGDARDLDVIPDFERYEQVLVDYGPLVLGVLASAQSLLTGALSLEQVRATVGRDVAHLMGLEIVLTSELAAAARGAQAAVADDSFAKTQVVSNQRQIDGRKAELESKRFTWLDFAGVTAWFGITAIITLATGGATAAIAMPFLPQLMTAITGDDPLNFTEADKLKLLEGAVGLKKLLEKKATEGDVAGTIFPLVLSFAKMLNDVNEIDGDDELKRLMRESVQLAHARLVAGLRKEQAEHTFVAAQQRLALAAADRVLAEQQLTQVSTSIDYLERVSVTLLRAAQGYMDVLMRYAFLAARSVEIYTGEDVSGDVFFDYGHVHPDVEADYADGVIPLVRLVGEHALSWQRFAGILSFRTRYDAYFGTAGRVVDKVFLEVADPARLAQFREDRIIDLSVLLADLPPTRREAKAVYVQVSLEGMTANIPTVSVLVQHAGTAQSLLRDDTVLTQVLDPRTTVVQAARAGAGFTGARVGDGPDELAFWGRGVATTWRVRIEDEEMTRREIDLSGLSGIRLEVGYDAFIG